MSGNNLKPTLKKTITISDMYENWYIDYASYVILERAIPRYEDGLKPVQRRILHALKQMEDGRYHKVANVIGQTMQYHPHGDAAINDALVAIGQKDLLIDTQGNWGDPRSGDRAAAARYIETRLTQFSKEIAFNKKWISECVRVLKEDGTMWISGTLHNHPIVGVILKELGLWIINDIIWFKRKRNSWASNTSWYR